MVGASASSLNMVGACTCVHLHPVKVGYGVVCYNGGHYVDELSSCLLTTHNLDRPMHSLDHQSKRADYIGSFIVAIVGGLSE
jgi:hypothetical protein